MPRVLRFFVPGIPRPGGSKRGFVNRKTGRVIITEDCTRSKDWRSVVVAFAHDALLSQSQFSGPIAVEFVFWLARPKGHRKPNGALRNKVPSYPAVKPDLTKYIRSTEDAMTGIVWRDDAQIVQQTAYKRYCTEAVQAGGCAIEVRELV
jgi:Holliday junction resolvase RusA-like endonuclease